MSKNKIKYIDYDCKIGDHVYWRDIVGVKYEGVLIKWNNNVAIIKLDNDTIKTVVC